MLDLIKKGSILIDRAIQIFVTGIDKCFLIAYSKIVFIKYKQNNNEKNL
jgi:hypothetical protein